jgi:tRNA pseudouridine55 synthase
MEVSCSKGTYIRTLCHDIGEKLGCFGCMESLLRTKVSRFELKSSLKLSEIQKKREEGKLSEIITPLDAVFFQYPAVTVKKEGQALAYNGNEIPIRFVTDMEERKNQEWIRVYDLENHFIGIFCFDKNRKKLTVEKMFLDQEEIRG